MLSQFFIESVVIGLALGLAAQFAKAETYQLNNKPVPKIEAMRALIVDPRAKVVRCVEVEMTDRGTMKNKAKK